MTVCQFKKCAPDKKQLKNRFREKIRIDKSQGFVWAIEKASLVFYSITIERYDCSIVTAREFKTTVVVLGKSPNNLNHFLNAVCKIIEKCYFQILTYREMSLLQRGRQIQKRKGVSSMLHKAFSMMHILQISHHDYPQCTSIQLRPWQYCKCEMLHTAHVFAYVLMKSFVNKTNRK